MRVCGGDVDDDDGGEDMDKWRDKNMEIQRYTDIRGR